MSSKKQDSLDDKSKKSKKKWVKCCPKDLKPEPKVIPKAEPLPKPVKCEPIEKPPKQPKITDKPKCEQSNSYRSGADQRAYLEQEVVPILMEGMLGLAREQPRDPISYLEKFWLQEQHKCDIPLPKDLL